MNSNDPRGRLSIPNGALDVPSNLQTKGITNWIDYGLWGLLFYDDQSPWMALIECMHILFYRRDHSSLEELFVPPHDEDPDCAREHEWITYRVPPNYHLRHLLFRDPETTHIVATRGISEDLQWNELISRTRRLWNIDVSYLRHQFQDVTSLSRTLDLLRSTTVDPFSEKRWTSRHLLPLGQDMLFADGTDRNREATDWHLSADRRFVRRTGEILYMMLGRSDRALRCRVGNLLWKRILERGSVWNDYAKRMRPSGDDDRDDSVRLTTGYLPFARLDVYDRLAEDWIALLSLENMAVEDILDPLMRLSALHQIRYILQRSQKTIGVQSEGHSPFVFDLLGSGHKNPVQRVAIEQYGNHVNLPRMAIEAHIDTVRDTDEWRELEADDIGGASACRMLRKLFLWPEKGRERRAGESAEDLLESFRSASLSGISHSMWSFLARHSREAGMVVARRGTGTWYAPSDAFLEALVLANVRTPIELGQFLRILYSRYRIVVGQEQAREAFGRDAVSLERMKNNEHRLEDRLRALRLIDRKSDACAFVVNPFAELLTERQAG